MLSWMHNKIPGCGKGYLSDKGGEVGVSEVFGKNLTGEGDHVQNDEPHVVFVPANDFPVLGVLAKA